MLSVHLQNAYPRGIPKEWKSQRFSRLAQHCELHSEEWGGGGQAHDKAISLEELT